jgi:hypothetical protein
MPTTPFAVPKTAFISVVGTPSLYMTLPDRPMLGDLSGIYAGSKNILGIEVKVMLSAVCALLSVYCLRSAICYLLLVFCCLFSGVEHKWLLCVYQVHCGYSHLGHL